MRYLVVIEKTQSGYSSYSPDLEGCIVAGQTKEEVEERMQEAIQFHLEGLREEGCTIPSPKSYSKYVEVAA